MTTLPYLISADARLAYYKESFTAMRGTVVPDVVEHAEESARAEIERLKEFEWMYQELQ